MGGNSFQGHKNFHLCYLAHEMFFMYWLVWLTDGKEIEQQAEHSINIYWTERNPGPSLVPCFH